MSENKNCECQNCGKTVLTESIRTVQLICEKVKNINLCEECHNETFQETKDLS